MSAERQATVPDYATDLCQDGKSISASVGLPGAYSRHKASAVIPRGRAKIYRFPKFRPQRQIDSVSVFGSTLRSALRVHRTTGVRGIQTAAARGRGLRTD